MKAITLWQPWASLIALRVKTIETRTHARFACLAGQKIAIHAGRTWDPNAERAVYLALDGALPACLGRTLDASVARLADYRAWPVSCVVARARVVEARWLRESDSRAACCQADGLYGLVLDDIAPFMPPILCSGHQGVWEWDPSGAGRLRDWEDRLWPA